MTISYGEGKEVRGSIYEIYKEIKVGSRRLGERLKKTLETLHKKPGVSIARACGDAHQAKAVYRILGNEKLSLKPILDINKEETEENILISGKKVILMPQDTTEVDYTNLKATEGLGVHGTKTKNKGIIVHTSMAVSEEGEIYGMLSQKIWVRAEEEHGKSEERKNRDIEDKESNKWLETMESSSKSIPEGVLGVNICDREGDIYEFFNKAENEGSSYLVRIVQNRTIESEENEKLIEHGKKLKSSGILTVQVPRDTRNGNKAREAKLEIKFSKVEIKAPRNVAGENIRKKVTAWIVVAEEIDAPVGITPILWYLLTNIEVNTFEEATKKVSWYVQRWKIERFHYVLKSGCKVEDLQERSAEKLKILILLYSIISMKILHLTYLARICPDLSCDMIFPEEDWQVLYKIANKTKVLPKDPPTIKEAVVMIAKLGGFLNRKGDGEPGVVVIWRGLAELQVVLNHYNFLL